MSTLRFWVLVLVIGGIIGIILPLINVYIPRRDKRKMKKHKGEPRLTVTEKHRLNLLVYLFYPTGVCLVAVILYCIESFSNTIDKMGGGLVNYVALIYSILVLSTFYFACLFLGMTLLEVGFSRFLKTYFEKRYDVVVLDDEQYFTY